MYSLALKSNQMKDLHTRHFHAANKLSEMKQVISFSFTILITRCVSPKCPEPIKCTFEINKILLKYGENPNQKSFFIKSSSKSIFDGQIQGNKMGYNNILDVSEGLACLNEFKEPTCVIIKHNNPCGVASDTTVKKSFIKAYQADSLSAFGGVVLFNRRINKNLSLLLIKYFFEIIVAPDFEKNSIEIFKTKKNLILIRSKDINSNSNKEFKTVASGTLFQNKNEQYLQIRATNFKSTS